MGAHFLGDDGCIAIFLNNSTENKAHVYRGDKYGLFTSKNTSTLISVNGCKTLCGAGNEYYAWRDSQATITTWILPFLGLLVQLPFESNAFRNTLWTLARWAGSPIASLSYVLWNIKVTGKCALMVDMATNFDEFPNDESDFAGMRNSLFILSVMNQYSMKRRMPAKEGEKLLRVALFDNILQILSKDGFAQSLVYRRNTMAQSLRERRKKGVVPIFITLGWFLFALALSIEDAFGKIGDNQTAHNLALGLLMGWLAVFVLATIVDRNPIGADHIRRKLNEFLEDVRTALLDPRSRENYLRQSNRRGDDLAWTNGLDVDTFYREGFFAQFAGQGR
ncbi:MAG: hypothetical protein Q9183_004758, partial [Haloplaca sp. 2 TL-2023]